MENDRTPVKQYVESIGKTYVQVSLSCTLGDEIITTIQVVQSVITAMAVTKLL